MSSSTRAAALRDAPPMPPGWGDTGAREAMTEQADLASALAPLRVEFDDASWARLGELLRSGMSPDGAAFHCGQCSLDWAAAADSRGGVPVSGLGH